MWVVKAAFPGYPLCLRQAIGIFAVLELWRFLLYIRPRHAKFRDSVVYGCRAVMFQLSGLYFEETFRGGQHLLAELGEL